ncbi:AAA family ATPase [Metabacillus malikii]|uniref:Nuclease SbcCD subunit C n=1 Tax=Metabacillus malikii TaxID=1504265 RepID=A0ABT9ZIZ5_9BACI|nr:AAA family ATPase [Metabacillus malikii]MDQ0232244.1 exonuclease SbcC [Metabacillus malikii]
MKPIQLTVSGLHSFREKQTIQFDTLCDGGIFGIFGPTGSGKSSILDAMTLALYGKVERAANNTHGILNHAEDSLSVSFTFELESASSKKSYTVERVFKRADEMKVKTSICRLIEVNEESIVLADKAVEVNDKINGLLGLTIDDFTRAVVLPQGKFAEFLSLKGAERRQMLQRLFHLEQYGDQLLKKLRTRLASTKIKRNELEAEKSGLGDASSAAVTQAEEQLKAANILLMKRQAELENITKKFEEKQKIWELQLEKDKLKKEKSLLEIKKDDIAQLQQQIKKAEEAEVLKPYAEALQTIKQERQAAEIQLQIAEKNYAAIKEKYEKENAAYEEIRLVKSEQEPKLVAQKEKLLYLQQVDEERQSEQKKLVLLQKNYSTIEDQMAKGKQELSKAESLVEKAVVKQQQLKEEIISNTVSLKEREMVRAAIDAKNQIVQNKQKLDETTEILTKKLHTVEIEKENLNKVSNELLDCKKLLREKFGIINNLYFLTSEREKEHSVLVNKIKNRLDFQLKQEEIAASHKLALKLVNQLHDGEPCPVCGSCTHPNPAHDNEALEVSSNQSDIIKQQLEQVQALGQEGSSIKIKLEGLSQQLVSEFTFLQSIVKVDERTVEKLIEEDLPNEQGYQLLHNEYKVIMQDYLQLKRSVEAIIKQLRNLQQEEVRKTDLIAATDKDCQEWQEKQKQLNDVYQLSVKDYQEQFSMIPLDLVEKRQQDLTMKDKAIEHLNERIEKSVLFIEEQQEKVKQCEQKNQQFHEQKIELQAAINTSKQLILEKDEKLKEAHTTKPFHQQIELVTSRLHELISKEKELYKMWQETTRELHEHQSYLAANEKAFEHVKQRLEEAGRKWVEASEGTSFITTEETLYSIIPHAEKMSIKKEIENYQDRMKQLKTSLQQIDEKLASNQVTVEEWQQLQQLKNEVKELVDEAHSVKGAANQTLTELLKKHERFMEIEKQQVKLDDLLQKLEKLQSVFKGNSFVEYVAEEQLIQVSKSASERLSLLTRGRYAIEVDSQGGFIMRDDANGGVRRPVSSLSGGETFLTSLALALSLSTQIQLRGEYPLQFFFLDEGFGTLDADLLDTVVTSLEKLQAQNLSVGVISHVAELRARLPKKLIVTPAEPSGKGTTVSIETI